MKEFPRGKSQFEVRKPNYLEQYEHFKDPESFKPIANLVKGYLQERDPSLVRCLDSMAGTGLVGRNMQKLFPGINFVYQDASEKMLSSDVFKDSDQRVLSNATDLSFADKSFDMVFCRAGLNNVREEDYPKILEEQLRVLNDGGMLVLMDHFAHTEEEKRVINEIETMVKRIEGITDEVHVPTVEKLLGFVRDAGGRLTSEQISMVPFSMQKRFTSKGIEQPDLSAFVEILKAQHVLEWKETQEEGGKDIIITYPITTIGIQK